jgi:thymidylate kinase
LPSPGIAFGLRDEDVKANPRPHEVNPESSLKSLFRWFYYLVDFVVGYYLKVFPKKVMKNLCIFDRYYYDCLVDKLRYNFQLPSWILKVGAGIIPKPDLILLITSYPETMRSRKQELPIEELNRQFKDYEAFVKHLGDDIVINEGTLVDAVSREGGICDG